MMPIAMMMTNYCETPEEGRRELTREVEHPEWSEVEGAILALDGERRNIVWMNKDPEGEEYMLITGRWEGCFNVYVCSNAGDARYGLRDYSRSDREIIIFLGGQDGSTTEKALVPIEWAHEAAKHY